MQHFRIKKGLDIPLAGRPEQRIAEPAPMDTVAVLGPDTIGLRPVMEVDTGEQVRTGQALFTDRQNPAVKYTSPGSGIVEAINRGQRRSLQSVVIRLDGDDAVRFDQYEAAQLASITREDARKNLLASGLWTALRTRPFSRVPAPDSEPRAIFVTAVDTNPHAVDPSIVIAEDPQSFAAGLKVLCALTEGPLFVCTGSGTDIPVTETNQVRHATFSGPHPAGLVGTHIHLLSPVTESRIAWHIGYQDVLAIGRLFTTGLLNVERIVALSGPLARNPRLLRTRLGASIHDLVRDELEQEKMRLVSGSVLSGRRATGPVAWLGRYHTQVGALQEGSEREFLAWARPGLAKFSSIHAYAAHLLHRGDFPLTTSQNGSPRAMVSIGSFEKVMPLDILATPLLKALLVEDTDSARDLGCLELDEEDLALCSFVCNGKYEYGPFLRNNLAEIEANG
ncbi:MAG: Na(+)-translocating NADH-quinone reductase subunit A [Woeseiaceae bacterium]